MVDVPFVIGLSRTDATNTLSSVGFQTGVIDQETLDEVAGKVVDQNPQSGTQAPLGSFVDITVTKVAPHPTHVPGTPPDPNVILDS
jgi:beta-lactam-binding protein with PASTA domain